MAFGGLLGAVLLIGTGATAAQADDCDFRVQGVLPLPDAVVLRTMRCLVAELARVKRENAELRRRLSAVENLLTELPAPYSSVDGVVTETPGRAIGTASFLLSARTTGGANALQLDQRVLDEVCGTKGGCAVMLAFRQTGLTNDGPKVGLLTGPCQFTFEPGNRAWTLGEGCGMPSRSGVDGDRFATGSEALEPVIVTSGGACLFSESEPARGIGNADGFQPDEGPGFFLVAMPARQPDGIRRFECELVFK